MRSIRLVTLPAMQCAVEPSLIRIAVGAALLLAGSAQAVAPQRVVPPPAGSVHFGTSVLALPSGRFAVTDPDWNGGVGAVRLYGPNGELISTLTGSQPQDHVGSFGLDLVGDDFVVRSPQWCNGAAVSAGAITLVDGETGLNGVVSPTNSMVGASANNQVGSPYLRVLANGNFVVASWNWEPATTGPQNVGAVTFFDVAVGTHGVVDASNSLVGSQNFEQVGYHDIVPLTNGNYVVVSGLWGNSRGAVTWGSGTTGVAGIVSAANSMVGSTAGDRIGTDLGGNTVWPLPDGNYVVGAIFWNNSGVAEAGAARWGNGAIGSVGPITPSNALVGSAPQDYVGYRIAVSPSSKFVVLSYSWDNGAIVDAGAATWMASGSPVVGPVTPANSLVGLNARDRTGRYFAALANGHFVIASPGFDANGNTDAGAATWMPGGSGLVGPVTLANSIYGGVANCGIGIPTALTNGNYVITSGCGDGVTSGLGLAHWVDGSNAQSHAVTTANSMSGSTAGDNVGTWVYALPNGNYVVSSPSWNAPNAIQVGAVTWGDGRVGSNTLSGANFAANSIIGEHAYDGIGLQRVLMDGNYLVGSSLVDQNGTESGAQAWINGSHGAAGTLSSFNPMVGSSAYDYAGGHNTAALPDGAYWSQSAGWHDAGGNGVGAVTLALEPVGGPITPQNSVVGNVTNPGTQFSNSYCAARRQLVVGLSPGNLVVITGEMLLRDQFEQ